MLKTKCPTTRIFRTFYIWKTQRMTLFVTYLWHNIRKNTNSDLKADQLKHKLVNYYECVKMFTKKIKKLRKN